VPGEGTLSLESSRLGGWSIAAVALPEDAGDIPPSPVILDAAAAAADAAAADAAAAAKASFGSDDLAGVDASCIECKPSPCFDFMADAHWGDIGGGGSD